MTKNTKIDAYQTVTDAIVDAIEAGRGAFRNRWIGAGNSNPLRVTGEQYRGINSFTLGLISWARGYQSPHWMTFKQALDLGGAVRKGEKSSPVVFYKQLEIERDGGEGEDGERETIRMARLYRVFNVDQIDGLPDRFRLAEPTETLPAKERNAAAESVLRATGARIAEDGGNRAFYDIAADSVHLPAFDRFLSTDDYLATLAHELCHWTGAKHRLDRPQLNRFGSPAYAEEELVAEIGAAFVCNSLGIAGEHVEDHAGYVESWLKALKNDKRHIFKAAAAAQAAADLVLGKAA